MKLPQVPSRRLKMRMPAGQSSLQYCHRAQKVRARLPEQEMLRRFRRVLAPGALPIFIADAGFRSRILRDSRPGVGRDHSRTRETHLRLGDDTWRSAKHYARRAGDDRYPINWG
jgi:hypothetical protein